MTLGDIFVSLTTNFVELFEKIIIISIPIGWDELGVVATVAAVIVALHESKKTSIQLKSALAMQEQTKNVELLDKRIDLCDKVQAGVMISELTFRILFNEEIFRHYKKLLQHILEKEHAEKDLQFYFAHVREPDEEGGYITSIYDNMYKYIADMNRPGHPPEIDIEYEKYCAQHEIWSNEGEDGEPIRYNHSEITGRIGRATVCEKEERQIVLQLMEKFISDSIQSVNVKRDKTLLPKKRGEK